MSTLTAANSEFILINPSVFAGPVLVQGYMVDDAFGTEDVSPAEAKIGVDGRKSSGFTPFLTKMLVHIQADSPSIQLFDSWLAAMVAAQDDLPATSAAIAAPSLGKVYDFTNGTLTRARVMPDAKKLFEGQTFMIEWGTFVSTTI